VSRHFKTTAVRRARQGARIPASLLFGMSPLDPITYGLVALGLVGIDALASYVPAHTATRLDPVRSLRGE